MLLYFTSHLFGSDLISSQNIWGLPTIATTSMPRIKTTYRTFTLESTTALIRVAKRLLGPKGSPTYIAHIAIYTALLACNPPIDSSVPDDQVFAFASPVDRRRYFSEQKLGDYPDGSEYKFYSLCQSVAGLVITGAKEDAMTLRQFGSNSVAQIISRVAREIKGQYEAHLGGDYVMSAITAVMETLAKGAAT